ncbi:MAG: helix-turn-helix transcriptional regulator [Clostridia bacterium]|nr:helix-turn-helix transcriptional regulator [Clostridia bacterium]
MALLYIGTSPKLFTYYGAHRHGCYEVILNLEGEGTITIGHETFDFFPGSVHVVPPDTSHIKASRESFRDIYFHTDTLSPSNIPLSFCDDSRGTLEQVMRLMLCRYLQGNKNDAVLTKMYELAMELVKEGTPAVRYDPAVQACIQRLTLSFNDPELSVARLLTDMGYSRDHLRRKFVADLGVTPNAYLTALRIDHAKKLLTQRELGLSVADVGAMCGYYDARYFSRVFKRETGFSPVEYAKKSAEK